MPPVETTATAVEVQNTPPGDLAIWVFIIAELLAFALFFGAYAFARSSNVELFDEMQRTLDRDSGAINTLLLITASWCVARAVHLVVDTPPSQQVSQHAARWLLGGIACGAGFLIVKLFEYAHVFGAGITLSTNTFYMFYISLTFFHFMHVILGMVILIVLWAQTRKGLYRPDAANGLESGAAYWHMVDLVWIILFPLVYVMR